MERDFRRLAGGPFDLLVIGGGVYGSWVAYDAALRGLRVALVEKDDWAAATSSASSKLIHGGLRYLERGHFRLVRKNLDERRRLARLAPHRVRPLRFVLPVYAGERVGRRRLRLGLWIYDRLAGGNQPVAPHGFVSRDELLRSYGLRPDGLRGGFTFGDCQIDDARFALEIVDGAIRAGTVAVNKARATALLMERNAVAGAVIRDQLTGETLEVSAGVTVDCTGPWCRQLVGEASPRAPKRRLTKGVHLVMPPLPADEAFLLTTGKERRIVFLLPWYGRTLVGTTDTDFEGDPDDARVEQADVDYLLSMANRVLEGRPWKDEDVIASFVGLRTLAAKRNPSPSDVKREWRLVEPLGRLLTPIGGKYSSARSDAAVVVDRTFELLGRAAPSCATAERPFPWSPDRPYEEWSRDALLEGLAIGLDEETAETCQLRHGSRVAEVYELIRRSPVLARRVVADAPFCLAEVVHAVTGEMALTLEDVVRRRLPLLLISRLSESQLSGIAGLAGKFVGWSDLRRRREIEAVLASCGSEGVIHETA